MTANRYQVWLFWRSKLELQEDTNLDPRDEVMLRQTLERMVLAKRRTLRLDLSEYWIEVHSPNGGRVHATCKIAPNGATQVRH